MKNLIRRSAHLSLIDAWKQKASRSFHVGNLSLRDMLPVISGAIGETFDLNKVSDKAYQPTKLVYAKKIYNLFSRPPSPEIMTAKAPPPDTLPPWLNGLSWLVEEAQGKAWNLWGFRMHLNQGLKIGNFTTFCEKCQEQSHVLIPIVEKITAYYAEHDAAKLLTLRKRYVDPTWVTLEAAYREGDSIIYKANLTNQVKIPITELTSRCFAFMKNIADLSFSRGNKENLHDIRENMEGPIFSNEMNGLCSYIYDHITNREADEQLHLGWQAMYNYVEKNGFKDTFAELLTIAESDENITKKIMTSWFGVIPVQFYRFVGYDNELLQNIETLFSLDSEAKNLIQQRWIVFRQYNDAKHPELIRVQELMQSNRAHRNNLLQSISSHPEIATIPSQTKRDGTLNELYHSQLDLLERIQNGFDPAWQRSFFMGRTATDIQNVLNIPLQKIL